jgi:hypothetical protein
MSPQTQKDSPYTPRVVTAICATKQILGKSEMIVAHDATGQPAKIRLQTKEARQIRRNHGCKHCTVASNSWLKHKQTASLILLRPQQPKI